MEEENTLNIFLAYQPKKHENSNLKLLKQVMVTSDMGIEGLLESFPKSTINTCEFIEDKSKKTSYFTYQTTLKPTSESLTEGKLQNGNIYQISLNNFSIINEKKLLTTLTNMEPKGWPNTNFDHYPSYNKN